MGNLTISTVLKRLKLLTKMGHGFYMTMSDKEALEFLINTYETTKQELDKLKQIDKEK